MLKNVVRDLRDGPLTLARVRRAFPKAYVNGAVRFRGDIRRTRLAAGVSILGPTVLVVTDGGGLSGARLEVGERTFIGELNNIRCAGAPVLIGRDCLISQLVTIVGTNPLE